MNEPNWKLCTEEEAWKYIAAHLAENGIQTVLVGGAVVAIYSRGVYRSGDLDLVTYSYKKEISIVLKEIGFIAEGRHFRHPECDHLFVEFVSPPVAIGNDYKIKPMEIKLGRSILKILSPTDCIKDRLASYAFFNARECFDQALLIAKSQLFQIEELKRWCKSEQIVHVFNEFEKQHHHHGRF